MPAISSQATRSLASYAVQLALTLMEHAIARTASRRLQREQADASVVMGV